MVGFVNGEHTPVNVTLPWLQVSRVEVLSSKKALISIRNILYIPLMWTVTLTWIRSLGRQLLRLEIVIKTLFMNDRDTVSCLFLSPSLE